MKKLRKPSFTTEFRGLSVQRVKAFDAGKLGGPGTRMVTPEPDGDFAAANREHPLAAAV